jgi:hypothetical protein
MKSKEEAVILIGDVHSGRLTDSYNLNTMSERFENLLNNTNIILGLHRNNSEIGRLNIFLLGDMVQGEDVEKQMMLEELGASIDKQRKAAISGIANFIDNVSVDSVQVYGVCGNHGNVRRKPRSSMANWDLVLYEMLEQRYNKYDRVEVHVPRKEYQIAKVLNWNYLIVHGCMIRAFLGLPFYGVTTRAIRWKQSIPGWDVLTLGHFHTTQHLDFCNIPIFMNGTFVTDDEYPKTVLGLENDPRMWMFGVHKDRPISWMYKIELERKG